jgi:hypothetical protein
VARLEDLFLQLKVVEVAAVAAVTTALAVEPVEQLA